MAGLSTRGLGAGFRKRPRRAIKRFLLSRPVEIAGEAFAGAVLGLALYTLLMP